MLSGHAHRLLQWFAAAVMEVGRLDGRELTMRQFTLILTIYLSDGPHTVRGLSERLGLHRPTICQNLNRLEEWGVVRRRRDPDDRRSVLLERTPKGDAYIGTVLRALGDAALPSVSTSNWVETMEPS